MIEPRHGLISGRYRLGKLLGSGGSASVFVATDVVTQGTVALKILHPHLTADAPAVQALLDAARSAMSVRHPNVAGVLGTGIDRNGSGPLAWISMQLAPGVSVAELVERDGPMGVDQALVMAEGVLAALEASHEAGLIHRDVSPANIMVAPRADGSLEVDGVRLIDFGITTVGPSAESLAGTVVMGNPNYISPEHAAGMSTDERGDLYQLGGALYTALTGRTPFTRDTVAEVLEAHRSAPPPVPSIVRPGLSRSIDRLIVRALLKHPDDRFPTSAAMSDAVRSARRAPAAGGTNTRPLTVAATTTVIETAPPLPATTARARRRRPRARPVRTGQAGGAGAALLVGALVASAWLLAANGPNLSAPATEPVAAEVLASSPAPSPLSTGAPPPETAAGTLMPKVEGSSLASATAALAASGLTVGALSITHSERPGDTVLLAAVPAGSSLLRGTAVNLTVASGSNLVPPVTLLSEAAGVAAIRAAGFVAVVFRVADAGVGRSGVVGATPAEGAVGRLGDEVTLVVSDGAVDPAEPPSPTDSPAPPLPAPTVPPAPAASEPLSPAPAPTPGP